MLYKESEQTDVMALGCLVDQKYMVNQNTDDPDRSILSVCWRHCTYGSYVSRT